MNNNVFRIVVCILYVLNTKFPAFLIILLDVCYYDHYISHTSVIHYALPMLAQFLQESFTCTVTTLSFPNLLYCRGIDCYLPM